jgi:hypothetical protein
MNTLVPLAGLEPATCCLGDDCPSSALGGPVGLGGPGLAEIPASAVWFGPVRTGGMTARMTSCASDKAMRLRRLLGMQVGKAEGQSVA